MKAYERQKRAEESEEEREARLHRMRERLQNESEEERQARLQQMNANQRERLQDETDEEREASLRAQALLTGEHASWKHATTATGVYVCLVHAWCLFCIQLQGLTQVEEMPSCQSYLYRLPLGQYGYSGHVISITIDQQAVAQFPPRGW